MYPPTEIPMIISSIKIIISGKHVTYGGDHMGKISDKSSYKNQLKATKSSKFFTDKQAPKPPKAK